MTLTVGDAVARYCRLSPDAAGSLRNRADASGLDPGQRVDVADPETLAAWVLAALAPNVTAARAANDLGGLRGEHGRLGEFLTGVFSAAREQDAAGSFGYLAQADVIALRDEDGAAAAVINVAAHADSDASRLDPIQMGFASLGASMSRLRQTAVLPGQALGALAMAAAGMSAEAVDRSLAMAEECRVLRRSEGHLLSSHGGVSYG